MTNLILGLTVYFGVGLGIVAQVYRGDKKDEDVGAAVMMWVFWPIAVVGGIVFHIIGWLRE